MTPLALILQDLQDTAVVLSDLQARIAQHPDDDILKVNAETLLKVRHDLELQLHWELRVNQFDLISYRIEPHRPGPVPADAVAMAVHLFQRIVTSVFDAIRRQPQRTYSPSAESVALSTMSLGSAKMIPPVELSFMIPNDRLLAVASDLDVTFETVLALLQSFTADALRQLAGKVGVSPLTQVYQWAANAVDHRLTISIHWQKSADEGVAVVVPADDALLLQTTLGSLYLEELADFDTELELTALDETAWTFGGRTPQGPLIGSLDLKFPRGGRWVSHKRYAASLTRLTRTACIDGREETYWTLRELKLLA